MAIGDNLRLARAQTVQTTFQNIKSQEALADRLARIGVARKKAAGVKQKAEREALDVKDFGELRLRLQTEAGGDIDVFSQIDPPAAQRLFELRGASTRNVLAGAGLATETGRFNQRFAQLQSKFADGSITDDELIELNRAKEAKRGFQEPKDVGDRVQAFLNKVENDIIAGTADPKDLARRQELLESRRRPLRPEQEDAALRQEIAQLERIVLEGTASPEVIRAAEVDLARVRATRSRPRISPIDFARGEALKKSLDPFDVDPSAILEGLETLKLLGFDQTATSEEQAFQEVGDQIATTGLKFKDGMDTVGAMAEIFNELATQGMSPAEIGTAFEEDTGVIDSIIQKLQIEDNITITRDQISSLTEYVLGRMGGQ